MGIRHCRTAAVLAVLALAAAAGCAREAAPKAAPAAAPPAAAPVLRQSGEEIARTTASLRQLDDLPMYEMTFHGGYDREAVLAEEELARKVKGWACSLYLRGAEFGRNFDWDPNPAMVVRADPPDGYASLSVVDLFYLLGRQGSPNLADAGDRRRLAHAVLAPFDGMNEKGLAVGLAAQPDAKVPGKRPGKTAVGSVRIIRILLDKAATVDEAVALMREYDVAFDDGPQVHYLIGDKSGRSVVVEYGDGKLNVIEDAKLTNITMTGTTRAERRQDTRYRVLDDGVGTRADGLDLLQRVAQGHTRWSVVYDLDQGTAKLVTAKRWQRVHPLALNVSSPG
ncbi:carcinine hydrolase/isopenicillin-N N-acyltransferase family protein [Nonomuraea sp. NPDC046570]|uniref:carcinine hydrolase/isopenicillin-N N-acyltransferase family protein n=1 Tax=Nonomuraea sp. NPDC046570 TaxID=3155255 RepID=UPI0033F72525